MAYNPNRSQSGTHRSTPLIARPSSSSHQNSAPPRPNPNGMPPNYLGNMMGGALAGMGFPSHPTAAYHYPSQLPNLQNFAPLPYYPSPQANNYYSQQSHSYSQPSYPSTSNYPYPLPPSQSSSSFAGLPSRPSHSALPPTPTPASSQYHNDAPHQSRSSKPQPPPRSNEFACKLSTCTFVSKSRRTTREHEEDRHLMFEPGREPKPWSGSLKPLEGAVIEGTGISLDTPEAVAKWIEDRKKRWPSKKVVEEKEKAREERIKAGLEDAPRERGAGRGRGRGRGGTMDRGRGRGGFRGGGPQGRTREGEEAEEPAKKKLKTSDDHNTSSSSSSSGSSSDSGEDDSGEDEGPEAISAVSTDALKALLGDEAEDDDDDSHEEEDNGEAVEEQSSKPLATDQESRGEAEPSTTKQFQVVCRHWRKGQCALGDAACPYLHTIPNDQPLPPPRRNRPHPRSAPHNPFSRPFSDPFQLLEEQDLKHVVSDLLQVVDFLKANDWLKGVETRVGQLDEESGIEVLDQSPQGITELEEEEEEGTAKIIVEEKSTNEPEEPVSILEAEPQPIEVIPPPLPTSKGLGLVADYASSDEEDEDAEEQVKQALLLSVPHTS